jgi:hypothetical protein
MYTFHGSVVERPHPIRGMHVQSQAQIIYLNLGSLHLKMKRQEISGAFRKIKPR